jgi:F420-0:gamma-glutamyl ligase
MFSIQDIERMSNNEINALVSACQIEVKKRSNARRAELIQAVCDAMNALHKEFPGVELRMGYRCSECGVDDDVDVIDYLCGGNYQITPGDFYIY